MSVASKAPGGAAVFGRTGRVCRSPPKHPEFRFSSPAFQRGSSFKYLCRIWSESFRDIYTSVASKVSRLVSRLKHPERRLSSVARDTFVSRIQSIRSCGCLRSHRTRLSVVSTASGAAALFSHPGQVCQSPPKHPESRLSSVAQDKCVSRLQSIRNRDCLQSHRTSLSVASKASGVASILFLASNAT